MTSRDFKTAVQDGKQWSQSKPICFVAVEKLLPPHLPLRPASTEGSTDLEPNRIRSLPGIEPRHPARSQLLHRLRIIVMLMITSIVNCWWLGS